MSPRFPAAIPCRREPEDWTDTSRIASTRARDLCGICPALDQCAKYAETLSADDRAGTVYAGVYYGSRKAVAA